MRQIQIKRFKYGEIETNRSLDENGYSHLTRTLIPKEPGFCEKTLVKGLEAIAKQHPELSQLILAMVEKINKAKPGSVLVFEEEARGNGKHRTFFENNLTTMKADYHRPDARECYAENTIQGLKF